jgi:hypothetical protein
MACGGSGMLFQPISSSIHPFCFVFIWLTKLHILFHMTAILADFFFFVYKLKVT